MSIVPLDRITLFGPATDQEKVIDALQDLGCFHLVNLNVADDETEDHAEHRSEARTALRFLESCSNRRRQICREEFDVDAVVADVLEVQQAMTALSDERDLLEKAIRDLRPWGNFELPNAEELGVKLWFYVVRIGDLAQLEASAFAWHEVNRDLEFAYIVVLSDVEPDGCPGTPIQLDPRPLVQLKRRMEEVDEQREDMALRRESLTRWCSLLQRDLNQADDLAARQRAAQLALRDGRLFALEGWAPRAAGDQIQEFAKRHQLAVTMRPPQPDEQPPTLLENPERVAGGEYCVTFYKTPGYWTWDPSAVVFFSFAIFFAMILADAGYALLLGLLLAWKWKSMGTTPGARKGRSLLLGLVGFAFIYGVLAGSYFGATPPALAGLQVLDVQNQAVMMPISIAIGIAHISLANFITAWRLRGRAQAFSSLGWISVMVGGSLVGISALAASDERVATQLTSAGTLMLVIGFIAVFVFSSQRPILSTSIKNHALRIVDGLMSLTRLSSLFGDVLSYLRLFALGLSSAQLAVTFNELGMAAWDSAGFGVLLAIVIVVVGHTLNLLLGLMSGVVHGLRLNCIEFFNWSLPDEGYLFRAFSKKARQP